MAKVKPSKNKKMSKPALAAAIISVVMLLALALSLLAGSGFFFRIRKGASTENFKVNASMMEYYTNSYMQNWYSNNYYYLYLMGQVNELKTDVPLNEQYVDKSNSQTYYDFFVEGAKLTVSTYLKYCEAAMDDSSVNFKDLEKAAKQYADDSIKLLKNSAKEYSDSYYEQYGQSITFNEYLKSNFGTHISKSDLKKALIIEHIASSYYEIIYDRFHDGITEDREDKYFADNLSTFVSAEYMTYTLSSTKTVVWPKAEDYVGGAESAAYKAKIQNLSAEEAAKINVADYEGGEEAAAYKEDYKTAEENKQANEESYAKDMEIINKLAAATTVEEFKRILLGEKFDTSFDSAFSTATKSFESVYKPSTDSIAAYKSEELKKAIIDASLNGEKDVDETLIKVDELKRVFLGEKYNTALENAYKEAVKDFADEEKPSEDAQKAYKSEELKTAIINAVMIGKEDITEEELAALVISEDASEKWVEAAKALPKTVIKTLTDATTKWIDAAKVLHKSIITNLNTVVTNATTATAYTLTSMLGQELFGGVKAQYDIDYESYETEGTSAAANTALKYNVLEMNVENAKLAKTIATAKIAKLTEDIAKETDADKKAELEEEKASLEDNLETLDKNITNAETKLTDAEKGAQYQISVYFVTEAAHRDEYKLRDVGHILFKVDDTKETDASVSYKTSEEAKAAAEALLEQIKADMVDGKISKEKFEEFAADTHDSGVFYEDVSKDSNYVESFKDWLFEAEAVGNVGLVETEYGWHIMFFADEGEEDLWRIDAHEGATTEEIDNWFEGLEYEVTFNEKIFAKIFGVDESHEGHNH